MMKVKVKFLEAFKDGTILGGKFFAPNTEAVITEQELDQIRRSGGLCDVVDRVIPNPLKAEKAEKAEQEAKAENAMTSYDEVPAATEETEPEKGRVVKAPIKGKKSGKG